MLRGALAGLMAVGVSTAALAVQPSEILKDPAMEAKAREISAELRCLVCQNQSIDDSDAPLAHDLRVLVRERLEAGDNEPQVLDFIVDRYGEFVLLRPRFSAKTYLLWIAPFLLMGAGVYMTYQLFRRGNRGEIVSPTPLSEGERDKLQRILDENAG